MGRVKDLLMEMQDHGYEFLTSGEKYVCSHHFEDKYLNQYIEKKVKQVCVHIVVAKKPS